MARRYPHRHDRLDSMNELKAAAAELDPISAIGRRMMPSTGCRSEQTDRGDAAGDEPFDRVRPLGAALRDR
ncbi:MAG: hypothetical protein K0S70_805 [Microbacterium sp.]|jgi:hypothetical protein|nr:hypothetical protein [Microbacterium sp.]